VEIKTASGVFFSAAGSLADVFRQFAEQALPLHPFRDNFAAKNNHGIGKKKQEQQDGTACGMDRVLLFRGSAGFYGRALSLCALTTSIVKILLIT
jgi:hypothetical protein